MLINGNLPCQSSSAAPSHITSSWPHLHGTRVKPDGACKHGQVHLGVICISYYFGLMERQHHAIAIR